MNEYSDDSICKILGRRLKNFKVEYYIKYWNPRVESKWIQLTHLAGYLDLIAEYENDLERLEKVVLTEESYLGTLQNDEVEAVVGVEETIGLYIYQVRWTKRYSNLD
jgi:hypothetical protein